MKAVLLLPVQFGTDAWLQSAFRLSVLSIVLSVSMYAHANSTDAHHTPHSLPKCSPTQALPHLALVGAVWSCTVADRSWKQAKFPIPATWAQGTLAVCLSVRQSSRWRSTAPAALSVCQQLWCECRQHPWFSQHLPRYLAVIQADTMATSPLIDSEMVEEVTKLGFDRQEVIHSVKTRQQNKARHLILV